MHTLTSNPTKIPQAQLLGAVTRHTQPDLIAREHTSWQAQIDDGLALLTVNGANLQDAILAHAVRLGIWHTDVRPVMSFANATWCDSGEVYRVPVLTPDHVFTADFSDLLAQIKRAKTYDRPLKVIIPGPLTFLYLSSLSSADTTTPSAHTTGTLSLLDALIPVYAQLFDQLQAEGVRWVQIDEPILVLQLPQIWKNAFERVYHLLQRRDLGLILASYYGTLGENLNLACHLPVAGLHIDITCEARYQRFWQIVIDHLPAHKTLTLGIISDHTALMNDQSASTALHQIIPYAKRKLKERLWLATRSARVHMPDDVAYAQPSVA